MLLNTRLLLQEWRLGRLPQIEKDLRARTVHCDTHPAVCVLAGVFPARVNCAWLDTFKPDLGNGWRR